jgi:hypothetical protein
VARPPRSYGQRFELVEGRSPRGLPCHCPDKTVNICYAPLQNFRLGLLLLRERRGAGGSDLGTTIKYLRHTTSGAASNDLGTTIKYLRRTTSGAAGNGPSR